ncbi:MAG: HAD family hydrolase [Verrucomicrobiia bacterium]
MSIRAVIFDVYGTLIEVGPPPVDADARWTALWQGHIGIEPRLSLAAFATACEQIIAREHAAARAVDIQFPEVYWPAVAAEVVPDVSRLPEPRRDEFLFRHAQLLHTVRPAVGADEVLRWLVDAGCLLGVASNSQPYTIRELDVALAGDGISRDIFKPALCFWSFEHGFSKPDPRVFRLLATRLRAQGIVPTETLMVGDRFDNDIEPARAQGWQTWHLTPGGWPSLRDWLQHR